jgi:predicted ArsR family transcriptional regulator
VHSPAQSTRDRLLAMVRDANGALRTGHRALGQVLGVSATRAGQLLKELAADGAIRVRAGKTGSVITLVPRLVGA